MEATVAPDTSPLIDDVDRHHAWARQAARFAVVCALLLEAVATPLTVDEPPRARRATPHRSAASPWAVRRVHLGTPATPRQTPAGDGQTGGSLTTLTHAERQALAVEVRGHLKRQPYGPGGTLRRWVYIAGYEARRWVAPRPARIIVSA